MTGGRGRGEGHLYGGTDEVVGERGHLFHSNQRDVSDARHCMGQGARGGVTGRV